MELVNLTVPNVALRHYPGGHLPEYPYLYVELRSLDECRKTFTFGSNNPAACGMLFRVLIRDRASENGASFLNLDAGGMSRVLRLRPNSAFHFSVRLPGGALLETIRTDTRE